MIVKKLFKQRLTRGVSIILSLSAIICIFAGCKSKNPSSGASPEQPQSIGIGSADNMRELGGYATQDGTVIINGKLLRGAALSSLSEDDISRLQQEYGLKNIIDFRSEDEVSAQPDPEIPGAEYYNIVVMKTQKESSDDEEETQEETAEEQGPVYQYYQLQYAVAFQQMGINATQAMMGTYAGLVTDEISIAGWRQMFDILLETEDGATLWHCRAGKDRTGIAAALILSALNVDRETIIEDFLLTNEYIREVIEAEVAKAAKETDDEALLSEVRVLSSVDRSFIEAAFGTIDQAYGSMDLFLRNVIGLDDVDFARLKEIYTQ